MKSRFFIAVLFLPLLFVGCKNHSGEKTVLFNGHSLMGWNSVMNANEGEEVRSIDVFGIKDGNIAIAGQPFGYIYTKERYSNYRLHVEWRWVGEGSNSGIFFHVNDADKVWPEAIECQLCAGKAGDIVLLGGAKILDFESREEFPIKERYGDFEKPVGKWNKADIVCDSRQISIYINGKLANECMSIRSIGHIALQSEGGPIEFRNIYLTKVE